MEDNQKLMEDKSCSSGMEGSSRSQPGVVFESASEVKSDEELKSSPEINSMITALLKYLSEDTLAADAKWNLFIAACQSYRYDSCLKPYPPMFFTRTREKDINSLVSVTLFSFCGIFYGY